MYCRMKIIMNSRILIHVNKLKLMKDAGFLTEDEFLEKKELLLNEIFGGGI